MAASAVLLAACGSAQPDNETGAASGSAARGEQLFSANCAECHGGQALGTNQGPPLIHEYYVPSHHADASFLAAVERGVAPHHWNFGAMPPVEGISPDEVADIVAYVRGLQQEAGLIE